MTGTRSGGAQHTAGGGRARTSILDARFDESLGNASSVMLSGLPVVETGPAGFRVEGERLS